MIHDPGRIVRELTLKIWRNNENQNKPLSIDMSDNTDAIKQNGNQVEYKFDIMVFRLVNSPFHNFI